MVNNAAHNDDLRATQSVGLNFDVVEFIQRHLGLRIPENAEIRDVATHTGRTLSDDFHIGNH